MAAALDKRVQGRTGRVHARRAAAGADAAAGLAGMSAPRPQGRAYSRAVLSMVRVCL